MLRTVALILACLISSPTLAGAKYAKVYITTTPGVILTATAYQVGQLAIDPNGARVGIPFKGAMKIKIRGNTTRLMPKKPFKIKLDAPASLLGMPSDCEWVLLANYSDKTLLRNSTAFEMGRRMGMAYTPRSQIVELSVNGQNLGTYLLAEQIKVSPARVNIRAIDITGGYLLELDRRLDGRVITTSRGIPYVLKEPEVPSTQQINYITKHMQEIEDVLQSRDFADPRRGYAQYIAVDQFVDWYLINEITKNADAADLSSIYFYKSSGQKLVIGPIWDFDLAFGNLNYSDAQNPTGWWIRTNSPWFARLFQDPAFEARVKARWSDLRSHSLDRNSLLRLIEGEAAALDDMQRRNFEIWDILNKYVWPNRVVTGSYYGEIKVLEDWLSARMIWMDQQLLPRTPPPVIPSR